MMLSVLFARFLAFGFLVLLSAAVFAAVPSVSSTTSPEGKWGNDSSPSFRVSYSGADGYSYEFDASDATVPDDTIDTESSFIMPGGKLDGTYWFHVRAHNSSGWSDTAHYKVMIDSSGPSRPESPSAAGQPDGSVVVSWGASTDTGSGMAYYNVYRSTMRFVKDGELSREFSIHDAVAKLVGSKVGGTSFTDTNFVIGEGYRFHYKILPVDNAGNQGPISSVASVKTASFCDLSILLEVRAEDSNLVIEVTSDGNFKKGHIAVASPGGNSDVVVESISNVNGVSAGYPLSGKLNGDYNISFSAIDDDGDECVASKAFIYDTVLPRVDVVSPLSSQELSGLINVSINAVDGGDGASGIGAVQLLVVQGVQERLIGEALKDQNGNYVLDWNTINYDNGRFKVIARATDRGGNTADDSALYTIKNTFFARVGAEASIASAESERENAVVYLEGLRAKGIDVLSLEGLLDSADSNFLEAKTLLAKGGDSLALADTTAKKVKDAYSAIQSKVTFKATSSLTYSYTQGQLEVFLSSSGLSSAAKEQAKSMVGSLAPQRKLEILEVKADSNTYYVASVSLSFTNRDKNFVSFIAIEPVPKQFARNASDLSSSSPLEVLRADPVLMFGPFDLNFGAKKNITYRISMPLTKAQADKLVSAKALDYYASPPIILPPGYDVSAFSSSPLLGGVELPNLELNSGNVLILGVAGLLVFGIIFLILVVVAVAVYYFFIRKKR